MALPTNNRVSATYLTDGTTKRFDFGFRVFNQADASGIEVRKKTDTDYEVIPAGNYSVTLNNGTDGGYVLFSVAPAAGLSIYIAGATPVSQLLSLTNYGNFNANALERSLDKIVAILQEWIDDLGEEAQSRLLADIKYDEIAQLRESEIRALISNLIVNKMPGLPIDMNRDYGAMGNDIANDSLAFYLLEQVVTKQIIDLKGKTYVVNSLPKKNSYTNGYFRVAGKLCIPNGYYEKDNRFIEMVQNALADQVQYYDAIWTLVPDDARPAAQDNALQSIVFDEINGYAYTHQNTSSGDMENAYISRYPLYQPAGQFTATDSMAISTIIGHQSMAVDYQGQLWGTGRDPALGAIRYQYVPDAPLSNYAYYKLHPALNMDICISYDQKWLIAQAGLEDNSTLVRVFELAKLINGGPGNYSTAYSYEFSIPNAWAAGTQYTQGIASDGKYIYLLTGRFYNTTNTCIHVYTFDGRLVRAIRNFNIGVKDSYATGNTYYEAETLTFAKIKPDDPYPSLIVGIAFGSTDEGRTNKLYAVGYNTQPSTYTAGTVNHLVSGYLGINSTISFAIGNTSNPAVSMQGATRSENTFARVSWCASTDPLYAVSDLYLRSSSGSRDVYKYPVAGDTIYRRLGYAARDDGSTVECIGEYWSVGNGANNTVTPTSMCWSTTSSAGTYNPRMLLKQDGELDITPSNNAAYAQSLNRNGSGYIQYFSRSGVLHGAVYLSDPRLQLTSLNGKDLALSTSIAEAAPDVRLILANDGSSFYPAASNATALGLPSNLYSTLYAATGAINTSDRNYKQQFRSQTEAERAAALEIKNSIGLFKFNDAVDLKGDGARWHVGVIAQDVIDILTTHGLDWQQYGFVCFDEWPELPEVIQHHEAVPEIKDEAGFVIQEACDAYSELTQEYRAGGSRFAIRYDELAMFILAAL